MSNIYTLPVDIMQVALVALTTHHSFHKELLLAIKSWPQAIYSVLPIISAIEPQLNTSSSSETLKEVCLVDWFSCLG